MNRAGTLFAVALTLIVLTTGCMRTFSVSTGEPSANGQVPGIPFYVVEGVCVQTTVYHERELLVELLAQYLPPIAGAPEPSPTVIRSARIKDCADSAEINQLREFAIQKEGRGSATSTSIPELINEFQRSLKNALTLECKEWQTDAILNQTQLETRINYSKRHYYNVRRPWFGSTDANLHLNDNGTIGQAEASIKSETMDALLDLVPFSDFLSARYIDEEVLEQKMLPPGTTTDPTLLQRPAALTISIKPMLIEHALSTTVATQKNSDISCAPGKPIPFHEKQDGAYNHTRKYVDLTAKSAKPETKASCIAIQCGAEK